MLKDYKAHLFSYVIVFCISFTSCNTSFSPPLTEKEYKFLEQRYGSFFGRLPISSYDEIAVLDLGYRDDPSGLFELVHKSSKLEQLNITHAENLDDRMFSRLQLDQVPELKILILTWTSISEKSVETINQARGIELLRVGGIGYFSETKEEVGFPRFTDYFLKELRAPQLRELEILEETAISDEGLSYLHKFPNLEELRLCDPSLITDQGLKHFRHCPQLRTVMIKSALIHGEGLRYLKDLPHLERLFISSPLLTDDAWSHLLELEFEKEGMINLASPALTTEGVDAFCDEYLERHGDAKVLMYRQFDVDRIDVVVIVDKEFVAQKYSDLLDPSHPRNQEWTYKGDLNTTQKGKE